MEQTQSDDSWCDDCGKFLSQHDRCPWCDHFDCDCICEFLRTEWPTHPANPDRRSSSRSTG